MVTEPQAKNSTQVCACFAVVPRGEHGGIKFCPLHGSAGDLLTALESIEKQTGERWVRTTARAAIAQAKGQASAKVAR